jgi:hypothetical protein
VVAARAVGSAARPLPGVLMVTDDALVWTPRRSARKRFATMLEWPWRELGGVRITSYRWLILGSYLTLQVVEGPWVIVDVAYPRRLARALEPWVRVTFERDG